MIFVIVSLALTLLVGVDATYECRRGATHQELGGTGARDVAETSYSGSSELQKDKSCCAECRSVEACEYWVRATDSDKCWLKSNDGGTIIGTASSSRRGGYRDYVSCFVTGDGVGGTEEDLGTARDAAECLSMAKGKQSGSKWANGATYKKGTWSSYLGKFRPGKCYAEYEMTGSNGDSEWETCQFAVGGQYIY